MPRMTIELDTIIFDALRELARAEMRGVKDQAVYTIISELLRRGILAINDRGLYVIADGWHGKTE